RPRESSASRRGPSATSSGCTAARGSSNNGREPDMDPIGDNGPLVKLMMDAAMARQRVIAKNLANVDTPGFKAREIRFSRELKDALRAGGDSVKDVGIEVVERDGPAKPDGNSVDLDRELSDLSENALTYQTLVTLVALKTNMMRAAIAGRGG